MQEKEHDIGQCLPSFSYISLSQLVTFHFARMIALNKPTQSLDIQITESPTAAALKQMLLALGLCLLRILFNDSN